MNDNKMVTILLVDDEPNVLSGYIRNMRKMFDILTATSGKQALEVIDKNEAIKVIVSDMRMPEMDGIELLEKVKATHPDIIRIMLTGNADQQTAIDAINKGDIFKFHTKPCSTAELSNTIQSAIEHYKIQHVEKELLKNTLAGAVSSLVEVLSLVNPEAFGRSSRLSELAVKIAQDLGMKKLWEVKTMAGLSHIGCVILPDNVLKKIYKGSTLTDEEKQLTEMHPSIGADIISKIPKMEAIAESLRYQRKYFDGTGIPRDDVKGKKIPAGSRILTVVIDFDNLIEKNISEKKALTMMLDKLEKYDPEVLKSLANVIGEQESLTTREVSLAGLVIGMKIAKDVISTENILIIRKGFVVSETVLERLYIYSKRQALIEPILVFAEHQIG